RMASFDFFDLEDHQRARARFTELASEQRRIQAGARALDNFAWRSLQRLVAAWSERDFEALEALLHPDTVALDHLRGPQAPPPAGRAEALAEYRATFDVGMSQLAFEPVAIRGDHLIVVHGGGATDSGFELSTLMLIEYDDAGLLERADVFSEDDLAG